jgi:hypothetical protein
MTITAGVDRRLTAAAGDVSTPLLVDLWTDHYPAHLPPPKACPECGHVYTRTAPLCPTAAIVRPLLRRRCLDYGSFPIDLALTYIQQADLHERHLDRLSTYFASPIPRDLAPLPAEPDSLFDPTPYQRTGGLR